LPRHREAGADHFMPRLVVVAMKIARKDPDVRVTVVA
jgi:hypothetical protein